MNETVKLISGNSNRPLAQRIGAYLNIPLCDTEIVKSIYNSAESVLFWEHKRK